jgi:predicted chitinase
MAGIKVESREAGIPWIRPRPRPATGGLVDPLEASELGATPGPSSAARRDERDAEGDVTAEQLQSIAEKAGYKLPSSRAEEVVVHINQSMAEAGIDTAAKKAAFIAQMMHESAAFLFNEEIASGAAYEGRADLGNTQPGDGERFKGRGFIQLTGRDNYEAAGRALGLDLVNHPELAASDEHAARVAAWFWKTRDLSDFAENGEFDKITRRINGGLNGKESRDALYQAALSEHLPDGLPGGDTYDESALDPVRRLGGRFQIV